MTNMNQPLVDQSFTDEHNRVIKPTIVQLQPAHMQPNGK